MTDLQLTWFLLVGILFAGYSVLEGIDGGVGTLVLARSGDDEARRRMLGTLGPATFGNEFWLVAGKVAAAARAAGVARYSFYRLLRRGDDPTPER